MQNGYAKGGFVRPALASIDAVRQGLIDGYESKPFAEVYDKATASNYEIFRLIGVTARVNKIALPNLTRDYIKSGKLQQWTNWVSAQGGSHSVPGWKTAAPIFAPAVVKHAVFSLEDLDL